MLPHNILTQIIASTYTISEKQLDEYCAEAKKQECALESYLIDQDIIDELEVYTAAAEKFNTPFIALKGKEIQKEILNIVPPTLAQTHKIIAFEKDDNTISLAMLDPEDIQTVEFLERKTQLDTHIFLTTPSDIKDALRRYHADLNQQIEVTQLSDKKTKEGDLKKAAEELPVINIVNSILEHAVYEGASDIHIEPTEKEVVVRYRVDGMLKSVMTLPVTAKSGITARMKILSSLKIDEHMVPQDGRFKIQVQDDKYSFRVSIIPVYDGEKMVLRLLHEGQKPLSLEELGLLPDAKKAVKRALKKPHGMVLVTGPTGSGKTTTLYSLLGLLNKPDVNISTIEDPIEYHVDGINQSQVNTRTGFTFAKGLRAFLRQDPDIIMVGEIRDKETAEIGIHAAMTGHMVLSTLHTNDAPTTLPRLLDMDIPPFLVAFTVNIIVGQRLIRKICEHCKEPFTPDEATTKDIYAMVNTEKMEALFAKHIKNKKGKTTEFFRGKGCRRCNNSGYKGRIGIYEILEIEDEIQKLINARASAIEIKDYAHKQNMITIFQDGLIKAKQGITTIEEVLRVTRD